jgi:small subunit ribosomal protein S1
MVTMEFILAPEGKKLRDIDVWSDLYEALERGTSVEAKVTRVRRPNGEEKNSEEECWELAFENKPGIIGLCPVKECGLSEGISINDFVGEQISCKIRRIDKKNSAVVCSRKEVVESTINRVISQLEVGKKILAEVKVVNRSRIYVDIGAGTIVRISQEKARLSDGVPIDVQYKVGSYIGVIVIAFEKDQKHIELEPIGPWEKCSNYHRGEKVSVNVVQIRDNLAFVKTHDGLIGRVYYQKNDKYNVGDEITVQVTDFNRDRRRLHLSIYDQNRVNDRRRQKARNRARRGISSVNPEGNGIKTLGGFDSLTGANAAPGAAGAAGTGDAGSSEKEEVTKKVKGSAKVSEAGDDVV